MRVLQSRRFFGLLLPFTAFGACSSDETTSDVPSNTAIKTAIKTAINIDILSMM